MGRRTCSELAVRTALGPEKSAKTQEVPIDSTTVNKANVAIAQAFGLGTGENVASSPLKTVLDTGYKVDGTVESNYALALAALSGVDSKQTGTTTAEKVNQTLSGIEKTFTTTNPLTNNSLSVPALQQLMSGALQVQPVVVQQTGDTTLNLTDKLAAQLTNSVGVKSVVTVVLSSASDVLGPAGQIVKFNFNQSVSSFGIQHIQLSPSNYTLSQLKRVDDLGTVWSALITPAPGVNESVSVSVSSSVAASSTTWSWTVDTQAPTAPTVSLGVTAANVVSDSGKFANDGISNVKTPRVRVDLSADAAVGDLEGFAPDELLTLPLNRAIRIDQAHHRLDGGGSARSVAAEQADDLAGLHAEVDAMQHMALAVVAVQVADLKQGAHASSAGAWLPR